MVVQRKAPVAPVPPTSRHNSSHAVPRASKPKQPSALANGSTTPKEPQPPPVAQNVPRPTLRQQRNIRNTNIKESTKETAKVPQYPRPPRTVGADRFRRLCIHDLPTRHLPVQSRLPIPLPIPDTRSRTLCPPQLYRVASHPTVYPYIEQAERLERETIRPVITKTLDVSGPYAALAKRAVWDKTLVPTFNNYVVPQYHAYVVPQWERHVVAQWDKHVVPQWNTHVAPQIALAAPHVVRAQTAAHSAATGSYKFYNEQVQPVLVQSYTIAKPYAVKTYVTVKPRALALYGTVSAQAGAARRAYVDPHVVKIWEKVLELSGAGPVGSPVTPAVSPVASNAAETTTDTTIEQESTPVPVIPEPEEEPVPTSTAATSSSSAAVVEITPSAEATTISVAEVVSETVAPVEAESETAIPSIVQEITVEVTSSVTESVPTPAETDLAAASVASVSAHGMESAVVEEILADATEEYDLLGDLGIAPDASPEPVVADVASEPTTTEKRADLEARMAKSNKELTALAKEKTELLRKTLVALRKAAAAKLEDDDSTVGKAVPELEKEAEKLLKGLDSYLKKDAKSTKTVSERVDKWNQVASKVEDRLAEKINTVQGTLQHFATDLKTREASDGMDIIRELKDACAKAQSDIGLELSQLHDVNYMDWQVYHALAQIGDDFQVEASEIQAGTHAHPPADPFTKKLKEVETVLAAVIETVIDRISALRREADTMFAKAAVPPEPEVSILPVPVDDEPVPVQSEDDAFDAGKVIIGKSAEQVEQALNMAAAAASREVHEEL
ncbi:hypothetical protein HMN09_01415200 [Mycena chlorophos]|uniref:Uncharacterized protein n=1 Tax=Mycena chlorophos TaxID=658473 RepID=A0A8H6RYZ7_MYCCL|nr:hypothetical protein HMN09_01415200 [Mycena chlorophos]